MPRPSTLDNCSKYLYTDIDQVPVTYQERIKRIRVGYTHWYEFPTKTIPDIRDHLMNEFDIARTTAYEDIEIIKILLGNIKNPEKEWIRYQVNAMCDAAFKMAKKQKDPKAMVMAADKKGKYNLVDKPSVDPLPFDEIATQQFEPTDDPTVLGLKKDPEIREKKRKMLEKYMNDIEIIDVPYEEMIKDASDTEETDIL